MVRSVVLPLMCVDVRLWACVFTLRVAFPRCPLDAAHLAGDPPDLLRAAPPAAHPGPPQRLQLHPRGRVHGGAAHARPAAHVPDPASLQGPLVCVYTKSLLAEHQASRDRGEQTSLTSAYFQMHSEPHYHTFA